MTWIDQLDPYAAENAEIEQLEWYKNPDIRDSPAFAALVAEVRRKHFKLRQKDTK